MQTSSGGGSGLVKDPPSPTKATRAANSFVNTDTAKLRPGLKDQGKYISRQVSFATDVNQSIITRESPSPVKRNQ
jgi:hypothetical protein